MFTLLLITTLIEATLVILFFETKKIRFIPYTVIIYLLYLLSLKLF